MNDNEWKHFNILALNYDITNDLAFNNLTIFKKKSYECLAASMMNQLLLPQTNLSFVFDTYYCLHFV